MAKLRSRARERASEANAMDDGRQENDDSGDGRNVDASLDRVSLPSEGDTAPADMENGKNHNETVQPTISWKKEKLLPLPHNSELSSLRRYTKIGVPVIIERLLETMSSHGMTLQSVEESGTATIVRRDGVVIELSAWTDEGGKRNETATGLYLILRPSKGNTRKCQKDCKLLLDAITRPIVETDMIVNDDSHSGTRATHQDSNKDEEGAQESEKVSDTVVGDSNQDLGNGVGDVEMNADDSSGDDERNHGNKSMSAGRKAYRKRRKQARRRRSGNGASKDAGSTQVVVASDDQVAAVAARRAGNRDVISSERYVVCVGSLPRRTFSLSLSHLMCLL